MKEIIARVVSQKGTCAAGHKVGDEFVMARTVSGGVCAWALAVLIPFAAVLQYGGSFPWETDPDKTVVACPDPENPVIFELRRESDTPKKPQVH